MKNRQARALIPPPKHAICRGIDKDRDEAILDIRALGGDKIARSIWGKIRGYSKRFHRASRTYDELFNTAAGFAIYC